MSRGSVNHGSEDEQKRRRAAKRSSIRQRQERKQLQTFVAARPWLAIALAAAALPLGARSEVGGLRGTAPVANTTLPALGSLSRANSGLNHTISAASDVKDQDQVDEVSIEDILEAAFDALPGNLSSFAVWDFSRCTSFPWELHCLPAERICPLQPWLPQCRQAPAPEPTPRPAPPAPAPVAAPRPVPVVAAPTPAPSFGPWEPVSPSPIGTVMTLYHQTSPEIAALILKSNFRPGTRGWCGGGIYFATTPEATDKKAIGADSHTGAILVAVVDVGTVLQMPPTCDRSITGLAVMEMGYDSIEFNPGDGDEFVVYSPDRVTNIMLYSSSVSGSDMR